MPDHNTGSIAFQLFHNSGTALSIQIPYHSPHETADILNAWKAAGFSAFPPDPQSVTQEKTEPVGAFVRRDKDGTPVIDLYPDQPGTKFPIATYYLNTSEQIREFCQTVGYKLDDIPIYVGDNKIERGKKPALDRFVITTRNPFAVVVTNNPKYSEQEAQAARAAGKIYAVPKRRVVRIVALNRPSPNGQPVRPTAPDEPAISASEIQAALDQCPSLDELNHIVAEWRKMPHGQERDDSRKAINHYAQEAGFRYDQQTQQFVIDAF